MTILHLQNLFLEIAGLKLLDGANLLIEKGERVALLGRNGAGKSTLLKLLTQELRQDKGDVNIATGTVIATLQQEVPSDTDLSIFDVIAQGLGEASEALCAYHKLMHDANNGSDLCLDTMGQLQSQVERTGGWELQQKVDTALSRLNLDGDLPFAKLSGGMKRRVMLAKALVTEPDLLLLDEPTNHLDLEAILWLEQLLLNFSGTIIFITHDRKFMQNVANKIVELDRGKLYDFPGDYENYLRRVAERLNAEEKQSALFDKRLAAEEVWIRQGIKARRTRNEGRVRALEAMRVQRSQRREQQGKVKLAGPSLGQSGKIVIEAEHLSIQYGERQIIHDFSTVIMRGDKIGILGPNGSGKSTLINILLQRIAPDSGTVTHGTKLQIAYFDQLRSELDENLSILENVGQGSDYVEVNGQRKHVISYLNDFLFDKDRVHCDIKRLSGGEKNRLLLAKLFTKPANLLVLDEPTNDLDIETLELLESLLVDFKGTMIIVSHDRAFIDNVVMSTMVFEEDGHIEEYVGGYEDYLRQRKVPLKKSVELSAVTSKREQPIEHTTESSKVSTGLSSSELKELKSLPQKIEQLENTINDLQQQLATPNLYQDNIQKFNKLSDELKQKQDEFDALFLRWETLEAQQSHN